MLKRKLQDLTVCCSYQVEFLHQKGSFQFVCPYFQQDSLVSLIQ
ncbi:unnamed protein product [Haemonchus placei]|uniref:Transcriptional regulator n=1 Tax=Haemonchus placei TaxID=6290 RepID=A0A0N4VU08_HAEPC|nr:unnamed protein product [Haemonchus placei]